MPHEPCCWIKNGVIVFSCVDDIVVAYHKGSESAAGEASNAIKARFSLQGGGKLPWFLGVAAVRDRAKKTIWLAQSGYIAKMEGLLDPKENRRTPMGLAALLPYNQEAPYNQVNSYQGKIGAILYAAVITRPYIALEVSRLARFNLHPGPIHHAAADKVIKYLVHTKDYALQLGGGDALTTWSDASFADKTIDRKSSQGYVMWISTTTGCVRPSTTDITIHFAPTNEVVADGSTDAVPHCLPEMHSVSRESSYSSHQMPIPRATAPSGSRRRIIYSKAIRRCPAHAIRWPLGGVRRVRPKRFLRRHRSY